MIIRYDFDNITSTKWPEDNEDIPTYTLEFFDGWQPPEVTAAPAISEPVSNIQYETSADGQVACDQYDSPWGLNSSLSYRKRQVKKHNKTIYFFCADFSQLDTTTSPEERMVCTSTPRIIQHNGNILNLTVLSF